MFDLRRSLSLRRGSPVLIAGAFERLFCPKGREFEQANLQKFKCPGVARGGEMLNFRTDRRIIAQHQIALQGLKCRVWVKDSDFPNLLM